MAKIDQCLQKMLELGASDLHLHVDYPLTYRIDGELKQIGKAVNNKQIIFLLGEILNTEQKRLLNNGREVDFAYQLDSVGRFRGNIFLQDGKFGGVFRLIPSGLKSFEEIGAPSVFKKLVQSKSGLILVTGPTGSGKSTTMATMINEINKTRYGHILTLEDPVEFTHEDNRCMITHKEIGQDIPTFNEGLKAAFKENVDVVLVGEIRDAESMQSALNLAESGVLVLATLHTLDASNTVKRVVSFFKDQMRQMVRVRFAQNINAILSMRLLPSLGGGRVAMYEVMIANQGIRNLIKDAKDHQIQSALQQGKSEGMKTFNMSLNELLSQKKISKDVADMHGRTTGNK
ncbi:MAG: PilT/PilU family type 4a pilus ATPase [bacterium]|nr:PilT/PilU family type 4a pilus ATPase [bacterium]